jgi:hypothetical protein
MAKALAFSHLLIGLEAFLVLSFELSVEFLCFLRGMFPPPRRDGWRDGNGVARSPIPVWVTCWLRDGWAVAFLKRLRAKEEPRLCEAGFS